MPTTRSRSRLLRSITGGLGIPSMTRVGALVIGFGLLLDVVEHTLAVPMDPAFSGGSTASEHTAHLTVLLGMVLVLVGIVADGIRSARRIARQEGSLHDAVR